MTSVETFPTAVAKARFVRISPTKARRVIDLVRGKSVTEALDILRWAPQAASEPVAKVIASAAANAQNNEGRDSWWPRSTPMGARLPSASARAPRVARSGFASAPATSR